MYNDYIIRIASRLFAGRMQDKWEQHTPTSNEAEQTADVCISLARTFFSRVQSTLPPEKPFEILEDADNETA